ncbi:MAG TPA: hypothetical protein VIY27_00390 [Myxococcota bacterium]
MARSSAWLGIFAALCAASCHAHYAWIALDADGRSGSARDAGDRIATFSDADRQAAVAVAAAVATSLGLRPSWTQRLGATEPTPENPFQELALFQGDGPNSNLMLAVGVAQDGSLLRFWISDLEHAQQTPLVRDLVAALKEALARAFPGRRITTGDGRKLRLYAG